MNCTYFMERKNRERKGILIQWYRMKYREFTKFENQAKNTLYKWMAPRHSLCLSFKQKRDYLLDNLFN